MNEKHEFPIAVVSLLSVGFLQTTVPGELLQVIAAAAVTAAVVSSLIVGIAVYWVYQSVQDALNPFNMDQDMFGAADHDEDSRWEDDHE